jgi:Ser/Thr protein kinase RdoA (MazF antagonist)
MEALPTDPNLPGLNTALDGEAFLDQLRQALPECGENIELVAIKTKDVRYDPKRGCNILYRLTLRDKASGSEHEQLLGARVMRVGEQPTSPSEELKARYGDHRSHCLSRAETLLLTPATFLPDVGIAVTAFPMDAALPTLFDVLDPSIMERALLRMWSERKLRVRKIKIRQLSYTPEARAALRYTLTIEDEESGLPESLRMIGKVHAFKAATKRFAAAWALWQAANGKIGLARPVGYIDSFKLSLQEQVQGKRLADLADSSSFIGSMRKTAEAIAVVHGLPLPVASWRLPRKEVAVVERWGDMLAAVYPEQANRINRLRDGLTSDLESRVEMIGPVHGDFHLANVLVDNGDVTLIDVDEFAYGDSLVDVGRLLAALRTSAARVTGKISGLAEAGAAFLDEYATQTQADERRIRLFEAASLMISAGSRFRLQRKGWKDSAAMVLDEAERVFALSRRGTPVAVSRPSGQHLRIPEGASRWVKDENYMQALLAPYIREQYGADVTACRVMAESDTNEGARVRYELSGWHGDKNWNVTLDCMNRDDRSARASFERLAALRDAVAVFPDALQIPRPVAYFSKLNMQVFEAPRGIRFTSILPTPDALDAARRLGRALAILHGVRFGLNWSRSIEDVFASWQDWRARLVEKRPDLAVEATGLLKTLERKGREDSIALSPVLRPLSPHTIILVGDRIALKRVKDVTLSHPFIDLADFLARLTLLGMERKIEHELAKVTSCLRSAYFETCPTHFSEISNFEAGALLRLAAQRAESDPQSAVVDRLVSEAITHLAVS